MNNISGSKTRVLLFFIAITLILLNVNCGSTKVQNSTTSSNDTSGVGNNGPK